MTYCDADGNGTIAAIEVLEETNYYAFGLQHKGYNTNVYSSNIAQKWKYNDRAFEDALAFNMNEMDWRQYDNSLGRFVGIDLLAEIAWSESPYHFAYNNPVFFGDPSGLSGESGDPFLSALVT